MPDAPEKISDFFESGLLKLHQSKQWPTFIHSLLAEESCHGLQTSTIPACSRQATCGRTAQRALPAAALLSLL